MYNQKPLLGTLPNFAHSLTPNAGAWLFNEGSGNKVYDIIGKNHGAFGAGVAAPTWNPGRTGTALDFDGGDHVDLGDVDVLDSTTNFSVSFWFYATTRSNNGQILMRKYQNEPASSQVNLDIQLVRQNHATHPNEYYISIGNGIGSQVSFFSGTIFPINSWTHLVVTRNTAKIYLYENSIEIASEDISGTSPASTNILSLGAYYYDGSWGGNFTGSLDEILFYNQTLDTTEVMQLHTNPYCWFAQPMGAELMYAAPPIGAIINQFQRTNLGADLYDGVLIT